MISVTNTIYIKDIYLFIYLFFFLERIMILYFKEVLWNFLKRIYQKYENILRKNGKYFILIIMKKFRQIMTNILRKFLWILKKFCEKERRTVPTFEETFQ